MPEDDAARRPPEVAPTTLLRPGVLDGLGVIVAGPGEPFAAYADAAADGCARLGASVSRLPADPDEVVVQDAVSALPAPLDASVLVCDAAGALARHVGSDASLSGDGVALTAALASTWNVIRTVVADALLQPGRPGRVIAIAPPADEHELADAARAALENLARTLSVEWARHGITTVSIAPGAASTPDEVAALTAFLASPAGAYYSGCELDLRGAPA